MKELSNLINKDANIKNKVDKIKQEIFKDQKLLRYLKENNITLSNEKIDNSLLNIINFKESYNKCENCTGLETCNQQNKGFKPALKDSNNYVNLLYTTCEYQKTYEAQMSIANNLKSFFMPKKILNATLEGIDFDESGRFKALNKIASFAKTYNISTFQKGVYLTGPFGIGKTHLLAAMANALAKRNIQVALVYLPDMIRELKSAIGTNNLENMINEIKNIQVLILDDIGSEMNTQWVRDEILGPILQYRMLSELPTFFASNKTIDELIKDYATTNDNVKDETKAKRIGDRIKALADEISVSGKNYRY